MAIQTVPFTPPFSADPSKVSSFGKEVIGIDPGNLSSSDFAEIQALFMRSQPSAQMFQNIDLFPFQYDALLFRNVNLSPEQQYALTKVQYPPSPFTRSSVSIDAR